MELNGITVHLIHNMIFALDCDQYLWILLSAMGSKIGTLADTNVALYTTQGGS